jgi:hypothetical protein
MDSFLAGRTALDREAKPASPARKKAREAGSTIPTPEPGSEPVVVDEGDAATAKPRVEVVLEEGRVRQIIVHPNGADRIVLDCDADA